MELKMSKPRFQSALVPAIEWMNRGFAVPTVCDFAQERPEYKGYEIKLQWGVPLFV